MNRRVFLIGLAAAVVLAAGREVRMENGKERSPAETLRTAAMFSIGPVGFAAQTSPEELALKAILRGPDPVPALLGVLEEATPAGELYALLGLSVADPATFRREAERLRTGELGAREVSTMTGCIVSPERFEELVERIERGQYAPRLETPLVN